MEATCLSFSLMAQLWAPSKFANWSNKVVYHCPCCAVCSHPLVRVLELKAKKGNSIGLSLLERNQLLIKLFADDSLIFLKAKAEILNNALQVILQLL